MKILSPLGSGVARGRHGRNSVSRDVAELAVTFEELADLAENEDGAEALRTAFGWERDRFVAAMKGAFAFSASLVIAVGASVLKKEIGTPE
jgi:hypothetical protein